MKAAERKAMKRAEESRQKWKTRSRSNGDRVRFLMQKMDDIELSREHWRARAEAAENALRESEKKVMLMRWRGL